MACGLDERFEATDYTDFTDEVFVREIRVIRGFIALIASAPISRRSSPGVRRKTSHASISAVGGT
ncbi:MAG: hypothetical protein SF182_28045, partial [Deltaproteobacteria bacterium]|nr:hypothetical protein [Deltaproteobacteria bacterium]